MTEPQHIEGLSAERVELLRSLPDQWTPVDDHGDAFAAFDGGPWIDVDGDAIGRSPAADALLATLDSHTATAIKEERERVERHQQAMKHTSDELRRLCGVFEFGSAEHHIVCAAQCLDNALFFDQHGSYVAIDPEIAAALAATNQSGAE